VPPNRSRRDWQADLRYTGAAALIGTCVVLLTLAEPDPGQRAHLPWELPITGISLAVLLLARRRHPVAVAVGLLLPELVSAGSIGAAVMATCGVAINRRRPVTAAVTALHVGTLSTFWFLVSTDREDTVAGVVMVVLLYSTAVATGLLLRAQRLLVESLRERARQAEEGQRLRVEEARHHERERLAREMHDVLAHRISLLAVHAGALEYRGTLPPAEAGAAAIIRQCAHEALEDLRDVINMLRDDAGNGDRPLPTLTDLPQLIEQSRTAGASVGYQDLIGDRVAVPVNIGRHAYRIVQEGLTNARKHAPGAKVVVSVATADGGLLIEIANPLPVGGPPAMPGAGAGLIGLAERVDLVGGRLEHGQAPGGGFALRAWLPLPA
jgi:signal transduction histidine kinase